jgi:hypothetical protein
MTGMVRSLILALTLTAAALPSAAQPAPPPLRVSDNQRFLLAGDQPFFWLGDTGWLLLSRLDRDETERYLATRRAQGFNVIQVMVLHTAQMKSRADAPALVDGDPARPRTTPGADPMKPGEYDFWDHLDWVADRAAAHGMYLALVPAWGDLAMQKQLTAANAPVYGRFLAERYGKRSNIIWLNGGDTRSEQNSAAWDALGTTIKSIAPRQLMTFHPIGRTASSWQWHQAPWLDFNMFQSGHRAYRQEGPHAIGEDNWRYVEQDLARIPAKPTIDGEPSYENIPHGLHEPDQPRWGADDARRYGWWAVMAGAFGHSYGENHVMQFFAAGSKDANFEPNQHWEQALAAPGATQMRHLRVLIESRPMLARVPDQSLIRGDGTRYDRVAASRGTNYAFAYSYTGAPFRMRLGVIAGRSVKASWFSPRDGSIAPAGIWPNRGERRFDPPGDTRPGNDWVLVLDGIAK